MTDAPLPTTGLHMAVHAAAATALHAACGHMSVTQVTDIVTAPPGVSIRCAVWCVCQDPLTCCMNRWKLESRVKVMSRCRCWLRMSCSAAPAGGSLKATSSAWATSRWCAALGGGGMELCDTDVRGVHMHSHEDACALGTIQAMSVSTCRHMACTCRLREKRMIMRHRGRHQRVFARGCHTSRSAHLKAPTSALSCAVMAAMGGAMARSM